MPSIQQQLIDKLLSARFIITVAIGGTYCLIVGHVVYFYLESMKANPDRMEAFATGMIMGYTGTATLVIKSYFDRTDRPTSSSTTIETPTNEAKVTTTLEKPKEKENEKVIPIISDDPKSTDGS